MLWLSLLGHWAPESKGLPPTASVPSAVARPPCSASTRTRSSGAHEAQFCPHFTFPLGHCILPSDVTRPSSPQNSTSISLWCSSWPPSPSRAVSPSGHPTTSSTHSSPAS